MCNFKEALELLGYKDSQAANIKSNLVSAIFVYAQASEQPNLEKACQLELLHIRDKSLNS
ncbi:hypothetical protein SFSGTM_10790 [Sulfuriferula nivalis]|uniref:Uncharacterized protein n=1 Tax=Sulfuriferula nivalis TaxID=2675298 RepID=A0A809RNI0_9PROT|nr:hypothetical protein SFSGTM_10790 [Sulfuriferula nivalis]